MHIKTRQNWNIVNRLSIIFDFKYEENIHRLNIQFLYWNFGFYIIFNNTHRKLRCLSKKLLLNDIEVNITLIYVYAIKLIACDIEFEYQI